MGEPEEEDHREAARSRIREWLTDGVTWVGGFENADLGHHDIGNRVLLPFDDDVFDRAEIGRTTAPDGESYGMGWRYLLRLKTRDADEAIRWLLP